MAKYHGIFKRDALFCTVFLGKQNKKQNSERHAETQTANEVCDGAVLKASKNCLLHAQGGPVRRRRGASIQGPLGRWKALTYPVSQDQTC